MDPNEAGGSEKEKEKEKDKVIKRRNRPMFLRYLERRKTDTIVADDTAKGDINLGTLVRRSQSDKTEYSAKLKEKMTPHDLSTPPSPALDPEEVRLRKMNRRAKVIHELVQTEKDYLTDLELCIREVVQPLRNVQVVDVDRLFTNMETVCEVSAALLHRLNEAMADPDPEAVVIGEVFIQAKAALEDVYKIYCYHHDDANMSLKTYEKEEEIKQHFTTCVLALKRHSLPPRSSTVNINEFKRRKDIVMKYKRLEDEGTLRGKLHKFNIHSIRKKGDRFAGFLKILTGVEPQVRDEVFDREEKLFRSLEKAVRQLVKNVQCYLQYVQEMVSVAVQNVQDMQNIVKEPNKNGINGTLHSNGHDPYKHFKDSMERLVLAPLSSLQGMFTAPQKLIQKRYDKLLDYCSRLERSSSFSSSSSSSSTTASSASLVSEDPPGPARRDYEALNALLVEELQRFNVAAYTILTNCVVYLVALLRGLMDKMLLLSPSIQQLPAPLSNMAEVQNSIMDMLNNLTFVKDNAQRLMERKVSFERQRDKKIAMPEVQHQTEEQRARLLAEHPLNRLYQLKRKCNGCQEQDLSLLEGRAGGPAGGHRPIRQQQPLAGSHWRYNGLCLLHIPEAVQPSEGLTAGSPDGSGSSSLRSFNLNTTDSSSSLSGLQVETESPEEVEMSVDAENEQFYAVYAFQARCDQELTLEEYQHVRILQFSDLGGNKDWWLAESNGQKGYVPANYLGRMSYA
ncbi:Rho guanine nucleotide exchange factor 38 [Larimichthys crocea]|uniref:Rho guanine nucleotide exchange factor 38 n=1 Tax=Larimichthys crocea TaxID=215358 RepID=A0A6G0J9H3_LARCR|nr:Rho guanine nucleotide exchange factor 38 [Larimichthys crocea]